MFGRQIPVFTQTYARNLIIHANKGHAVSFHCAQTIIKTLPASDKKLKCWEVNNYLVKLGILIANTKRGIKIGIL